MARTRAVALPLLLAAAMVFLLNMAFVAPHSSPRSTVAMEASTQEVLFKGGAGSVGGGAGLTKNYGQVNSMGASSAPAAAASSSTSSQEGLAPGTYVIGMTVLFFISVYANDQGFFGPW